MPGAASSAVRVLLVGTGVHPIPPTGYGGVERTIAELARALEEAGAEVVVLQQVRRERTRDEYPFALALPRLLARERFDVVHASTPVVANRLALARRPFVYTTHSRHWFEPGGWTARVGFWLERRAVARAARTIALTDRLADRIRAVVGGGVERRLTTIPIGVDADRFRPVWSGRLGRVALGVGVVRPFKRWEVAAAALRGTGWRLDIIGPTPDPDYARRVVTSGDEVRLLGEVSDAALAARFATADVFIHPSRVELLAGVVLQALAAGLPVLGADPVAGLVSEGTGFIAPADLDDAGIASFLRERALFLAGSEDARRRMGEAARASALDRFAWPAVAQRHLALYRSLLDEGALTRR